MRRANVAQSAHRARVRIPCDGVRVWDVHNGIPAFAGGVLVAAPTPVHRMAIDIATPNASLPGAVTIAGWAFNEAAGPNA